MRQVLLLSERSFCVHSYKVLRKAGMNARQRDDRIPGRTANDQEWIQVSAAMSRSAADAAAMERNHCGGRADVKHTEFGVDRRRKECV
ncbi:hypothetical protein D3C73_1526690 [compost metagenome]